MATKEALSRSCVVAQAFRDAPRLALVWLPGTFLEWGPHPYWGRTASWRDSTLQRPCRNFDVDDSRCLI